MNFLTAKKMILLMSIILLFITTGCEKELTPESFLSGYDFGETKRDKAEGIFEFTLDALSEGYSYLEVKERTYGFSFHQLKKHYKKKVENAADYTEIFYYIDEMISILNDKHTVLSHEQMEVYKNVPFTLNHEENEIFVDTLHPEWAKQFGKLNSGMKIVSIDNKPIDVILQMVRDKSGYQYVRDQKMLVKNLFVLYSFYFKSSEENPEVLIIIEKKNGEQRKLTVQYYPAKGFPGDLYMAYGEKYEKGIEAGFYLDGQVGYVDINTFSPKYYKENFIEHSNEILESVQEADTIILDIRNNPGGDFTKLGKNILSHFIDHEALLCAKEFKNSKFLHVFGQGSRHYPGQADLEGKFYPKKEIKITPAGKNNFSDKTVYLLVDRQIMSAADMFLNCYSDFGIGKIVGRTRQSNSGQPIRVDLPLKTKLSFCSLKMYSSSGKIIEDRLIEPNIHVEYCYQNELDDTDHILNAALDDFQTD